MNKPLNNFIDMMKQTKLSSTEKADILERTFSIIEKIEAISIPGYSNTGKQAIRSPFVSAWQNYILNKKFIPAFAVVALLFMTGGASLAAETALPGDSLYGFKINVNEELRGLGATTPEAKGKLAVEATERRLQEAATLSTRGRLDDQAKNILQTEISKHATQVKNQVASLVSQNNFSGAQEVTVNYESSLRAHELVLEKVSIDGASSTTAHLGSLIDSIKTQLATTTESRVDLQNKEIKSEGNSKVAVTAKLSLIRSDLDNVINLLENSQPLSTTTDSLASDKITFAQVATVKAEGYIASSSYSEAFTILQQASQSINDAESAIIAETGLDNDVKKVIGVVQVTTNAAKRGQATSTPATNASSTASTTMSVGASASSSASTTLSLSSSTTPSI